MAQICEVPCVLVVEDDADIREVICDILADAGFAVRSARNGAEALAELNQVADQTCLVLADWQMPIMGGEELLGRIRSTHKFAPLPVIITTASGERMPETGVMRKPLSADVVLQLVRNYCAA
jgi:CheY-like chemotaxis protein